MFPTYVANLKFLASVEAGTLFQDAPYKVVLTCSVAMVSIVMLLYSYSCHFVDKTITDVVSWLKYWSWLQTF